MDKLILEKAFMLLKEKFPKFIPYWETFTNYWEIYEGITALMTPFSQYAVEVIKANDTNEIKKIFDFIEFLLSNGDDSVRNAVTTIFLENLMNKDPDEIQFTTFAKYLGENSIGYCRAWDKFCGVKTKGLYDDGE